MVGVILVSTFILCGFWALAYAIGGMTSLVVAVVSSLTSLFLTLWLLNKNK